jgi:hypothetical protein
MSQPGTPSTWQTVADDVNAIFQKIEPLITVAEAAYPPAAAAMDIVDKIIQGYSVLEPTAVEFVNQIRSGTPLTPAQLQQYASERQEAYVQAKADIAAALAALPPS